MHKAHEFIHKQKASKKIETFFRKSTFKILGLGSQVQPMNLGLGLGSPVSPLGSQVSVPGSHP